MKGHSFSSVEFFLGGTGAFFERTCRMGDMKAIRLFLLATVILLISTGIVAARAVRIWPYQELLEKSDLVAIAAATATNDTKENIDVREADGRYAPVVGQADPGLGVKELRGVGS